MAVLSCRSGGDCPAIDVVVGSIAAVPADQIAADSTGEHSNWEGHSGLSQVVSLITLKSGLGGALIGWMLVLLMCNVGAFAVNKEHLANESNCAAFLNPVHCQKLFKQVNDAALTSSCGLTV